MLLLALRARLGRCPPTDCHPAGPAGPYVAGGPVGPDGTLSPFIPDHAGPAGRHVAIGPVGPFGTLSPSDCHPAGPYVAWDPVGPDGTLSPFIPNHAGPAGRHVAMGPFGMLSPPDCYSPGPTGPCITGGPVGPDGTLSPCISDHADPAGRHVAVGPSGTVSPVPSSSAILVDPGGRKLLLGDGGPKFCPDVLEDDLVLGAAVPLPAVDNSRVALSPGEVLVGNCDVTTDGNITAGLDGWSAPGMIGSSSRVVRAGCAALPRCTDTTTRVDKYTEGDNLDQFETFNAMPVYYGGDLYEDSDWDDPYAIASAAYVDDYNFDFPEGMDLMVHDRRRDPYSSDIRQDRRMGLTHLCQTLSCDTRDEWDTMDVDSLTEAFTEDVQDTDDFYQRIVSSDEEDFGDPDDGSVADLEMDTWTDACSSAFGTAFGAFPPEAADTRPAVVFSNRLFSEEELADTVISVRRDVPRLLVQ